ncbi:hypothetical protein HDV00_012498, partial [Rhizophlyctis rosea]
TLGITRDKALNNDVAAAEFEEAINGMQLTWNTAFKTLKINVLRHQGDPALEEEGEVWNGADADGVEAADGANNGGVVKEASNVDDTAHGTDGVDEAVANFAGKMCLLKIQKLPRKQEQWLEFCTNMKLKPLVPIVDVPIYQASYFLDKDLFDLGLLEVEWTLLEQSMVFFKSFHIASDAASRDKYPTHNLIIPLYNYILEGLDFITANKNTNGDTMLDPHFKLRWYPKKKWGKDFIARARAMVVSHYNINYAPATIS